MHRPDRPRTEGNAPEPLPIRQLLEPEADGGLPEASRTSSPTWRRSCARRWTSSFGSAPPTSSSTRRSTRSSSIPGYRDFYEGRGWPADRWLELGLELDNLVIGDHPGVTFGIHLCRGNQASRWLVSGGYDWLATRIFPRVQRAADPARVRRRALGRLRAARGGARRQDGRSRPRDDEERRDERRWTSWRRASSEAAALRGARTARAFAAVRLRDLGPRQRAYA